MKKLIIIFILLISINVNATNTIVMDLDSERIIYQKGAYEKRLIASTTKVMTFIVAYEYGKYQLDEYVEAKEEILEMYGTSIYLNYKEKMTLRDLLYGLILRSGNDAAVVIANYIGGTEEKFVELMNKKAKEIGMHNTIFANSHGLDEKNKNYSTAYDLALLSCYANKIDLFRLVSGTKYYKTQTSDKAYSWTNRNKLLFLYDKATGGKTGYTPSAGKTFISTAKDNNLNLTIVTLNDPNTYEHHQILYEEYFNLYKNYIIVSKSDFNKNKEFSDKNIYIQNDIIYPLTIDEYNKINYKVYIDEKENIKNNEIGYIEVILKDEIILKKKIYLKKNVQKQIKSLWQKILDWFNFD